MKSDIISALILEKSQEPNYAVRKSLELFSRSILEKVLFEGIRIHLLHPGQRYGETSKSKHLSYIDSLEFRPAGIFVRSERTAYISLVSPMTIVHEFGHAIDCALGGDDYYSTNNESIAKAFLYASNFVTPYAASRVDEYFAECVRAYVGVNDSDCRWPNVSPELLKRVDPVMYKIIQALLD